MRTTELVANDVSNVELTIETTQERLDEVQDDITSTESKMENFDKNGDDVEDKYIDALDSDGTVTVAGMEYDPSRILQELDPTAYRCGLVDFADSCELEDFDDYNTLVEELAELETSEEDLISEIEDLEVELEELENELEELENEENQDSE
jgi:phage shock protein A